MEHRPDRPPDQPHQQPTSWGGSWSGPAAPNSAPGGPGGQRRLTPTIVAGAITAGIVLAMVIYAAFLRSPADPEPPPNSPSSSVVLPSQSQSATAPTTSGSPAMTSTRNPPPTPTRSEARTDQAPIVAMGEAAEFVDGDAVGLVTVLAAEWLEPTSYRAPAAGYEFLAVQVEVESIKGELSYGPGRASVSDSDAGRYSYIFVSGFTDHPQFETGKLAVGEVMNGWVLFELPRGDSTFIWESYDEQATRVEIGGDGPITPVAPQVVLDKTFTEELYDAKGSVRVEGITWFTESEYATPKDGNAYLGVKVRITAIEKLYYASTMDFAIELADGTTVTDAWLTSNEIRPALYSTVLAAGDEVSGWLYFEVPQADCVLVLEGNSYSAELGRVPIPA